MADTVARAIKEGNEMVCEINYLIAEYQWYAKADTAESATFARLLAQCIVAKEQVIAMMNAHLDAMREINNFENRDKNDQGGESAVVQIDIAEQDQFEFRRMQLFN